MTDKEIYLRARRLFEAEHPGRSFSHGPVIRMLAHANQNATAEPAEREGYISRARNELAQQSGMPAHDVSTHGTPGPEIPGHGAAPL